MSQNLYQFPAEKRKKNPKVISAARGDQGCLDNHLFINVIFNYAIIFMNKNSNSFLFWTNQSKRMKVSPEESFSDTIIS